MIKVGDLVAVVYTPHECLAGWLGATFVVTHIGAIRPSQCARCGAPLPDDAPVLGHAGGQSVALSRLQKIEPKKQPAVMRTIRPQEEIAG